MVTRRRRSVSVNTIIFFIILSSFIPNRNDLIPETKRPRNYYSVCCVHFTPSFAQLFYSEKIKKTLSVTVTFVNGGEMEESTRGFLPLRRLETLNTYHWQHAA